MQQAAVSKVVGKQWNASGSWGEEDDGGWSQGPPASGSGWMGGTAAANGSNRDIENWGQNSHDNFIDWQRQQPPNVIVDRNDKEAWPSIGGSNHSETASDHDDDNASGKSGSVISVSSNHGQGQEVNISGSSAIQGQNASSLWSDRNSSFNGVEPSTWGVGLGSTPSSSAASINSIGWGSSNPSLSMNQGHNMQSITSVSGSGSDLSNSLSFSSRQSAGWGAPGSLPQGQNQNQGGNRPQNPVQIPQSTVTGSSVSGNIMQGAVPGSGAPQQQNGPQMSAAVSQLGSINNPSVQQGNSAFQSIGFPRTSADSAWGSTSSVASPVGANNVGSDAANAGKGNSGNNGQKSSDSNVAGGWGMLPNAPDTSKSTSGWPAGNPSTSSDWGNPPPSNSQWGSPVTPSQQGTPQWPGGPQVSASNSNQAKSNTTWAQAATKGLAPSNNSSSSATTNPSATAGNVPQMPSEKDQEIMKAIESHDGWGQKPVRQDTAWDLQTASPKTQRKFSNSSTVTTDKSNSNNSNNASNMWNNNNGTAIWEPSKEDSGAWNNATPTHKAGPQWDGSDRNSWTGPPKQNPETSGNAWGGSGASGNGSGDNNQSTEIGSWPSSGDGPSGGISTWGEDNPKANWDGNSQGNPNRSVGDGTYVWGEPPKQPQNWNTPANPNVPSAAMVRGVRPQSSSGWGDPGSPNTNCRLDDGTGHWGGNQQRPPSGFGEPSQWNPAVGPPKPKPSTSSSSSWGEEWNPSADPRKVRSGMGNPMIMGPKSASISSSWGQDGDMYWNNPPDQTPKNPYTQFNWGEKDMVWNHSDYNKDDMMWNDDGSSNWDDADMGTWNDNSQENNSSWSSASGWKGKKNIVKGFNKFPGGNQPQMRSRMLQQLMEMGFPKDEAQHALISNNMNFQNALADLYKQKGANVIKRDFDMDVFHDGAKPKLPGMDIGATDNIDISDTQLDNNPYVPNISMQNTPFQNAQLPNQFIANYKGPSLPPSSQQNNNVSIMPQQQRLIQEKFKQQQQPNSSIPPPPLQSTQGMVNRNQIIPAPAAAVQQQMAQQQILQQLHLAVKAGLISPQLLNQQLPPPMLVMLQQLLQHQQCLQQLITTQQLIQQNKMGQNPMLQRQQLEQAAMKINSIKQLILNLQRQISDAQRVLIKQQPSTMQQPQEMDPISSLPTDMANLNITNQTSQAQNQQQPQQSKLSQWKRATSEKETNNNNIPAQESTSGDNATLNKAPGSKPGIPQSHSTPNLEFGLGLTNLGGDSTWSNSPTTTSSSQNWPSSIGSSGSSESTKDTLASDIKESHDSPITTSSTSVLLNDSIPEFVPGKPWQGITTKSVEDDPHITPGSFSLTRSFSVNTVKENDLVSLTKPIPSTSESPSWSTNPKNMSQKWIGDNSIPTSFSNEVWGVPLPKNTSRPPPGLLPNKTIGSNSAGGWSGSGGINRQHSWAGTKTDPSSFAGHSGWDSRMPNNVSTCLILRNLTPQIDGSTLRTLCLQHGPLQWFYLSLNQGQALVRYNSREEAMKAQKSLNTCVLGNTTIVAEFVSDAEAARFVEQSAIPAQPSQWSQQQQNSLSSFRQSNRGSDGSWNTTQTQVPVAQGYPGNMWGTDSRGGLWGGQVEDHNALLGNMLGESM